MADRPKLKQSLNREMQEKRQQKARELDEGWYLPFEVVVEILVRLPVISLLKFTAVCKEWNSLIKNSEFVRRHRSVSATSTAAAANPSLLLRLKDRRTEDCFSVHSDPGDFGTSLTVPFPFRIRSSREPFCVFGSLHGLICLADFSSDGAIFIWNPMARRYLELPRQGRISKATCVLGFPDTWILGFGYDSSRDDYKLVRVHFFRQTGARRAEVYSLKENKWREVVEPKGLLQSCYNIQSDSAEQCFLEGAVHWVMPEKNGSGRCFILTFNVSEESFNRMELPEHFLLTEGLPELTETKVSGSLTVMLLLSHSWEVWVKKEYTVDTSWTKFLSVRLVDAALDSFLWIVGLWHDQVIIRAAYEPFDYIDINSWQGTQCVCSDKSKEISFADLRVGDKFRGYAADYQESLVLCEPGTGAATYGDVQILAGITE